MPILEVYNLKKCFGSAVALDGVSFTIEAGELFGLLGPNGAGKTTFLSLIAGLLPPTSGEVRIRGKTLDRSDQEVRRLIGIVPQELALYEELTARENLVFFGELYGLRGTELQSCVAEVLTAVGLADRADQRVSSFSGGMKRRLNLGAGLVHRPPLLLLDEPTVGVDPQSRNHLFEEVRRLNAAGITIVYTSHYMEEVQTLCRRVGILDHGRLVACDTLPGLLRRVRGSLRFRADPVTPLFLQRLHDLPGTRLTVEVGDRLELECGDVKATLLQLLALLSELSVELHALEMEEPNLEHVFFDLTQTALRD
jgi:ABC-2 type transport system ATP-binding protein